MAAAGKAYSKQSVKKTGKERKEKLVAEIVEKLDNANGLVFTDYKGISHQQLEELRKELKTVDSSLLIAKNSLMKISLGKSKNYSEYKDSENLVGPVATLFTGKDSVEPLKKLQKSIKDSGLPTIKFGILEGQLLDEAGVIKLASLPTREVLLAQFVGMLNAPIQGFVSGLNAIPQKFVMTLDAIAKAKPAKLANEEQAEKPANNNPPTEPAAETSTNGSSKEVGNDQNKDETLTEEPKEEKPTEEVKDDAEEKPSESNDTNKEETKNEGGETK